MLMCQLIIVPLTSSSLIAATVLFPPSFGNRESDVTCFDRFYIIFQGGILIRESESADRSPVHVIFTSCKLDHFDRIV